MTKVKTRPDSDAGKTIGKIAGEVRELERIKTYLKGGDNECG